MTSAEAVRRWPHTVCRILLVSILLVSPGLTLRASGAGTEVWLVTYGPGEIYWQRFGHNAIWIRDEDLGLDHTFNFGFFDFAQEDFFRRFLQGRMLYFSAAQPASAEFAQYIDENRSIRAQRLALTDDQALGLAESLISQVQPENRDYLYDYYLDNCSTRVRDALDRALGGHLFAAYGNVPAPQNFRDHTRRLTGMDFWLYLGLELGLGSPVDRSISRWEEFFIPGVLADGVARLDVPAGGGQALVIEDVTIHEGSAATPPAEPGRTWPRYLLCSLGILVLVTLLGRWVHPGSRVRLAKGWLLMAGAVGLLLLFFWFGTDHTAAGRNLNVLLFNPIWLIAVGGTRSARTVSALLALAGLIAVAAPVLPPYQYSADVLAAFLPLNIAAAWVLHRTARAPRRRRIRVPAPR